MWRGSHVGSSLVGCVHIQTAHLWWAMTAWDPRSRQEDAQDEREESVLEWEQEWKWKTKWETEMKQWNSKQGRRMEEREVRRQGDRQTKPAELWGLGRLICSSSQLCLSSGAASTNKTPPMRFHCTETVTLQRRSSYALKYTASRKVNHHAAIWCDLCEYL